MTDPAQAPAVIETRGLHVRAGARVVLRDIHLRLGEREILAILGPSGAGKSTLLRCLNRLIDLTPTLHVEGEVLWRGRPVRDPSLDVNHLRARLGMIFQQPVVFPTTIRRNVLFGRRHLVRLSRADADHWLERSLGEAHLWNEVKDRLDDSAVHLSVGQQQRLCLARTLAVEPEVLLLDEPTSALDPASTEAIEALILHLRQSRAILLVTHNHPQARRLADRIALLEPRNGAGELTTVHSAPADPDDTPTS